MALSASVVPAIIAMVVAVLVIGVAHECGHLIAARWLHIPVRRITFGHGPILLRRSMGDNSEFVLRVVPTGMAIGVPGRRNPDGTLRRPLGHDMTLAVAGPIMSFLLAALLLAVAQAVSLPPWLQYWLVASALLSATLAAANLAPLPGLDGGHLLLLGLARLDVQLSPKREIQVQRIGVNLLAAGCVLVLVVAVLRRL
jgi:membrane-associated protease RseP (regulator of RpoE activity)